MINVGESSVKLIAGVNKEFKLRKSDGTLTTQAYQINSKNKFVKK